MIRAFQQSGIEVVVLDDLSTGRREFVSRDVPFVQGSLTDPQACRQALVGCDGVIHLGGLKYAGVSVREPSSFYRANVEGTRILLDACQEMGVLRAVFSSSASVFGTPDVELVDEDTPFAPESPYGQTKVIGEWLFEDAARARDLADDAPFEWVALRYFNVVGSGQPGLYDTSPYNLFPLVNRALAEGRVPTIFGTDYGTEDGTCVRDYIHVQDVAEAHVLAATRLMQGTTPSTRYNLGRGEGVSVRQIMDAYAEVTGIDFTPAIGERRPGDPDRIVTSAARAHSELGWQARFDLRDMVRSSWETWPR